MRAPLFAAFWERRKTELVTSSSHDFHKTLQTTVRALSLVKTGVGAGQIVFLRPKIRSLFVERNAFFSELDFHAILPCVILVVFYVIPNPPGLRRKGSGGESEARQHNENPRPTPLPGKVAKHICCRGMGAHRARRAHDFLCMSAHAHAYRYVRIRAQI